MYLDKFLFPPDKTGEGLDQIGMGSNLGFVSPNSLLGHQTSLGYCHEKYAMNTYDFHPGSLSQVILKIGFKI